MSKDLGPALPEKEAYAKKKGSRDCATCLFALIARNPQNQLLTFRVCRRHGPPAWLMRMDDGQPGIIALERPAADGHWCYEYWPETSVPPDHLWRD